MSAPEPAAPPRFDLWEGIVRQIPEAIVFADREGRIRIWNRSAELLFGFSADEALGQSLDIIIPERLRKAHWEGFDRAIALGRTQHGGQIRTTRAVHRDGGKRYVDMSFGVVVGPDGVAVGAVAMARDASAKRALEDALRACREAQGHAGGSA